MTISRYSISISLQSGGGAIFNGYFSVDNTTNLVVAFYETINGSTNFNNNILLPTGSGFTEGSYGGFTNYYYIFYTYPDSTNTGIFYHNAYLSNWLQFDGYGVVITSMSAYPQYNLFNLYSRNLGDETKTNIGEAFVGTIGINNEILSTSFTITPTSNPISNTVFSPTELGGGFSGISPKPFGLVERGNQRGMSRMTLRRAGYQDVNSFTANNPVYNTNYIIEGGQAVKNKAFLKQDSSDRTRRLKLKAENLTYNNLTFGGDKNNGSYTARSRARY